MTKEKALSILRSYPHSPVIKEYGYCMLYCPGNDVWYGCYDSDKGGVWYWWEGTEFKSTPPRFSLPENTLYYDNICRIANG